MRRLPSGARANGVTLSGKFDGEFARGSPTYAGTGTLRTGAVEQRRRTVRPGAFAVLRLGLA
jgi:hypothetical protein